MAPDVENRILQALIELSQRVAKMEAVVEAAAEAAADGTATIKGRIKDHEARIRVLEAADARSGRFTPGDMIRIGASIAGGLAAAVVVIEGTILALRHL